MQRIPGHDDELSFDGEVEAGAVAPLRGGGAPQGRARAGLATAAAAILGLAILALAFQASHGRRAAADLGDRPSSKETLSEIQSSPEDTTAIKVVDDQVPDQYTATAGDRRNPSSWGTLVSDGILAGDTLIKVQDADAFYAGDHVVIVHTEGGHQTFPGDKVALDNNATMEEAVVVGKGDSSLHFECPVTQDFPVNSYVVTGTLQLDTTYGGCTSPRLWDTSTPRPQVTYRESGMPLWVVALLLGLAVLACLVLCGFCMMSQGPCKDASDSLLRACCGCCRPKQWIFKPLDGRAVETLTEPSYDAPPTGMTVKPGEVFDAEEEVDTREGKFIKLADGRGWVMDKEGDDHLCYRLFEPVDELWFFESQCGSPIAIRDSPSIDGERTGEELQTGHKFKVCEMQVSEQDGATIFLKLKDGRGWVFDQDYHGDQPQLCFRIHA